MLRSVRRRGSLLLLAIASPVAAQTAPDTLEAAPVAPSAVEASTTPLATGLEAWADSLAATLGCAASDLLDEASSASPGVTSALQSHPQTGLLLPDTIRAPLAPPLLVDSTMGATLESVDAPSTDRTLHPVRASLAAATLVGGSAALYAWEKSRWWEGSLSEFHYDDHLDYAANMDKAAHFYATKVLALSATEAFEWAGLERKPAALGGALTAWLLQLQVEYHDGFYPQWGFDRYDVAANTLGAAWFYGREQLPDLRRFDVRWGYVPRTPDPALWFNEDYQHHSYWVSTRVHDLLPEPAQRVWPEALTVTVGTAVADWDPARPYETGRAELYLSLDLDYNAIVPLGTRAGRSLADFLNRFHLPAPALRLAPEPRFYLVFYGQ